METADKDRIIKNLVIYSIAVIALGWIGVLLDQVTSMPPGRGPGMILWILAPLLVSFSLRRIAGGWKDFGLRLELKGNRISNLTSILFYPLAVMAVLYIGKVTGKVHFFSSVTAEENLLIATFSAMIIPQLIQNILEESGFRGYMAPKFEKLDLHPLYGYLITGFVWGLWHLPYMRAITSYTGEPLITLIPRFLIGTMVVSILYGEIRRRTQSIWPSIIMQTMGGAFIGTVFASKMVMIGTKESIYFSPVLESVAMILISGVVGLLFLRGTLKGTDPGTADN